MSETKAKILVIDDEPDIVELLSMSLESMGMEPAGAGSVREGRQLIESFTPDMCLTDLRLPDGDGLEIVKYIAENHPDMPVAVISAHGNMELAIECLKAGAFDFLTKPVNLENLKNVVSGALKIATHPATQDKRTRTILLGDSEQMCRIRGLIPKLARSQAPVYISGESGTGKEMIARLIHQKGPRADQPFIPVNCGAIPDELMESEFFGHKKGSFTGAVADKAGLFQAADGGTLFLDEVADLPLHMQTKLLRVIQEKAVKPIGAEREIPVDVRILSATHKNLAELVEKDKFRQDLFYRINVIDITAPPLRQRDGDLPILIEYFLRQIAESMGEPVAKLTPAAREMLLQHSYPGNIRELQNILERATTLCVDNVIDADDLSLTSAASTANQKITSRMENETLEEYLARMEKDAILAALEKTRFNRTAAAKELGVTFRALRYKLEKLEIDLD